MRALTLRSVLQLLITLFILEPSKYSSDFSLINQRFIMSSSTVYNPRYEQIMNYIMTSVLVTICVSGLLGKIMHTSISSNPVDFLFI
jgi:hypothetical protein